MTQHLRPRFWFPFHFTLLTVFTISYFFSEPILLSTLVTSRRFFVFKKQKCVVCTNKRILVLNAKRQIRFADSYSEILGLTKSLRIGSDNMILHFGTRPDEEWACDKREELVDIILA